MRKTWLKYRNTMICKDILMIGNVAACTKEHPKYDNIPTGLYGFFFL
jgi:hypothetical protein